MTIVFQAMVDDRFAARYLSKALKEQLDSKYIPVQGKSEIWSVVYGNRR